MKVERKKKVFLKNPWFYGMVLLMALRIYVANWVGNFFPVMQEYDDALLVQYADLYKHFKVGTIDSLLKYLGYPVFLKAVSLTPFSYATWTAVLWIIAALCVWYIADRLTEKEWFSFIAFTYVLFLPMAFERFLGTRLYRNAIIAPCSSISISLMILMFLYICDNHRKLWKSIVLACMTGISFTFTYYLKEDGIWLLCCYLFAVLLSFILFAGKVLISQQRTVKAVVSAAILFVLPLLIFKGGTVAYKNANEEAFGVAELNTRTQGELGEFVNRIYRIESPNRTGEVWAPYDAIKTAYDASPTFQKYPQLLESIHNSGWFGNDVEQNPITGDFLTWVLRTSLNDTGIWENEKQISDLFCQINQELDEAFASGEIKEQKGRIQLLSSAGGRTVGEILSLGKLIRASFKGAILLEGYEAGALTVIDEEVEAGKELCEQAADLTNTPYLADYSSRTPYLESANAFCRLINRIYKVWQIICCLLIAVALILEVFSLCYCTSMPMKRAMIRRKHQTMMCSFMVVVFLGVGMVYSFGIAWFSSFLFTTEVVMETLNFYNAALPVFLMFAYLFTGVLLVKIIPIILTEIKWKKRYVLSEKEGNRH